jgi:hypothetical protein
MKYELSQMKYALGERSSASQRDASLGRRWRFRSARASHRDASLQDAGLAGVFPFLPSDTFLTECKARHFDRSEQSGEICSINVKQKIEQL